MAVTATDTHRAIDAVWRIESARLIAGLARIVRDVGARRGARAGRAGRRARAVAGSRACRDNPGAWLMADREAPRHRPLAPGQAARAQARGARPRARGEQRAPRRISTRRSTTTIGDDLLRLVFTACHPVLSTEARVALTLRLLGGLTTDEIARAFLVPEPTIAQRIVRAKRTLAEEQVPFEVPRGAELAARLSSVLEVIYLIFNEGYSATAGDDWMRPALCEDALRLGRILAELAPEEPEVHGLVALMEIQASRAARARRPVGRADPAARPEPRALGSAAHPPRPRRARARRGARRRARPVRAAGRDRRLPRARAAPPEETDWARIAALYDALAAARAVAGRRAQSRGRGRAWRSARQAGLELVDALTAEPSLQSYHLLPSVRGDLLAKLGRLDEARRGVRARGVAHAQRPRARAAPGRAASCSSR